MPRYFFHIDDGSSLPDREGTELANLDEAREHAVMTSGEILRDLDGAFWQHGRSWRMHVTDEANRLLFTLRFSADVPSGEISFVPLGSDDG